MMLMLIGYWMRAIDPAELRYMTRLRKKRSLRPRYQYTSVENIQAYRGMRASSLSEIVSNLGCKGLKLPI